MVEVNQTLLRSHPDSLMHRCTAARMMVLLDPTQRGAALALIAESPCVRAGGGGEACEWVPLWRLSECVEVQRVLEGELADAATADSKGGRPALTGKGRVGYRCDVWGVWGLGFRMAGAMWDLVSALPLFRRRVKFRRESNDRWGGGGGELCQRGGGGGGVEWGVETSH